MLYYELKKIIQNKRILFSAVLVVMLSSFFFIYQNFQNKIAPSEYRQLQSEMQGKTESERIAFLKEKEDEQKFYYSQLEGRSDVSYFRQKYGLEWMEAIQKDSSFQTYSQEVIEQITNEEYARTQHADYLNKIKQQYATQNKISIFQKGDERFVKERADKTVALYDGLDVKTAESSDGVYGIQALLELPYVDICCLIFLMYLLYQGIVKEDETQLLSYMQLQHKGKAALYLSKGIAMWICIAGVAIISYLILWFLVGLQYGFVDLFAPIQYVYSCISVPFAFSTVVFLILTLLGKCFLYFCFTSLLYILYLLYRNYLFAVTTFLLLGGGCWWMASLTADTHWIIAELDPMKLMRVQDVFIYVPYLQLFSHAVSYWFVYILLGLITFLLWLVGYRFFIRKRGKKKRIIRTRNRKEQVHSLVFYENKKLWWNERGLLVMLLSLICIVFLLDYRDTFTDTIDIKYNYYVDTIGTEVNTQTLQKVEKEDLRLQHLQEQLLNEKNLAKRDGLYAQLMIREGFQLYQDRILQIQESQEMHRIIKENEWRFLFENRRFFAKLICICLILLVLLAYKNYERDIRSKVLPLQEISYQRATVHKVKYISAFMAVLLWFVVGYACLLAYQHWLFPNASYHTAFYDIPAYYGSIFHISTGFLLILQFCWQISISALLLLIYHKLFQITSHPTFLVVFLISFAALPILLTGTTFESLAWLNYMFFPWMNPMYALCSFLVLLALWIFLKIKGGKFHV